MSYINSNGVRLYVESTGRGLPIVFVHEFAGDHRSWEPQVRYFGRRYRCFSFSARGYIPSDVPENVDAYNQEAWVEDIANIIRETVKVPAHIIGLSMGGYATLNFGLAHPEMCRSLVIASAGHGSDLDRRKEFLSSTDKMAERMLNEGMDDATREYRNGEARRLFQLKDPHGFAEANAQFVEHSALGSALTSRGYQMRRATIYDLQERMETLQIPTLIMAGDHDDPCLDPALFMKRTIPDSRLWIMPYTTHALNLEEPDMFNRGVLDFLTEIDGRAYHTLENEPPK
ncbi:alpha/beta fold hydrolase [Roseovarius sp. MMSF_3350]|uniref:alpha/beta fold hydrolase n=1 Tax=Roseovarius sp. MMSF_3350 TaxID=3046706 RepID=UPI00273F9151|nr:alpha/beta hydrolase [Roseovarius sp. MMSF_3350]